MRERGALRVRPRGRRSQSAGNLRGRSEMLLFGIHAYTRHRGCKSVLVDGGTFRSTILIPSDSSSSADIGGSPMVWSHG